MPISYTLNSVFSASDEQARCSTIIDQARLVPESSYYGTPTCRVVVVPGTGLATESPRSQKQYPLTLDIADKISKLCCYPDGDWAESKKFTEGDNRIISKLFKLSNQWDDEELQDRYWSTGALTARQYDTKQFFFPVFNTIYENESSPLRYLFNVLVCASLERLHHKAWRQFTSDTSLSDAMLIEKTNQFVIDAVKGRYTGVSIIPETIVTEEDKTDGTSWHIEFHVRFNDSHVRFNHTIVAHRSTSN